MAKGIDTWYLPNWLDPQRPLWLSKSSNTTKKLRWPPVGVFLINAKCGLDDREAGNKTGQSRDFYQRLALHTEKRSRGHHRKDNTAYQPHCSLPSLTMHTQKAKQAMRQDWQHCSTLFLTALFQARCAALVTRQHCSFPSSHSQPFCRNKKTLRSAE